MRKHPLLVLTVLVLTLSVTGLFSQGAIAAQNPLTSADQPLHRHVDVAQSLRPHQGLLAPSLFATAPLPFVAAITRWARVAPELAHPTVMPAGGPWLALRRCESGDNYREDTGNGFYGAYQFAPSTWTGLGFHGLASEAAPATQDRAARLLQARAGWSSWPVCSVAIGVR